MPRLNADASARQHLVQLLKGGQAHLDFDAAVKGFPVALRGKRPKGSPHSPWELLEHMRIAQWDILEFTRDPKHVSPEFPSGYWPAKPAPPDQQAWDKSVKTFRKDLKAMIALVSNKSTDLYTPFAHGQGQTVFREAVVLADHTAYHLGQFVLLRKMLGA
jgi:hypothetical protein